MHEVFDPARLASREVLTDLAEKYSAARLERVVLDDGTRYVLKHLDSDGDWLTRACNSAGRVARLWSSGYLAQAGRAVDHTIVDCVEDAGGWTVVMRDATADLFPLRVPIDTATAERALAGLAQLHDVSMDDPPDGLCSLGARYAMFAPAFHRNDSGPGPHPLRETICAGWDVFFEMVHGEVADAVAAVHRDPAPLNDAMSVLNPTLLHGDAKLENMGLSGERLVLVDWGDLTGTGPREADVAWFVLRGASRITDDIGSLFAAYPRPLDPRALDLACIGSLAQMGFRMANSAAHGRPDAAHVGRAQLEWWTQRVREALPALPY